MGTTDNSAANSAVKNLQSKSTSPLSGSVGFGGDNNPDDVLQISEALIANAGIVILGENSGGGGADVWYTSDASAMTDSNSYQIATVSGADRSTIDAGDFNLKG